MHAPSWKSKQVEKELTEIFGFDRRESIVNDRCVPPPIGCGKPIKGFRNALSEREYTISGLCQDCQDQIFSGNPENWLEEEEGR